MKSLVIFLILGVYNVPVWAHTGALAAVDICELLLRNANLDGMELQMTRMVANHQETLTATNKILDFLFSGK